MHVLHSYCCSAWYVSPCRAVSNKKLLEYIASPMHTLTRLSECYTLMLHSNTEHFHAVITKGLAVLQRSIWSSNALMTLELV